MAIFSRRQVRGAVEANARGGLLTHWQYDEPAGAVVAARIQDIEPILEDNKRLQTLNDGYSPSRELRRVARIPDVIIEMWNHEGVNIFDKNCMPEILRRLNDRENLFLRTAPGRL